MKISKIGIQEWKPFKKAMEDIVQKRAGFISELKPHGEKMIDTLETQGFIKTGKTLGAKSFDTTKSADTYYRNIYGAMDWGYQIIKGEIKRLI